MDKFNLPSEAVVYAMDAYLRPVLGLLRPHGRVRGCQPPPRGLHGHQRWSVCRRARRRNIQVLLEVAPGVKLFDTPKLPKEALPESIAGGLFLDQLRREEALDWTFISPAALFFEGPRTGSYRVGGDQLLTDADGKSTISFADYAIALADEVEAPKHRRARFSVAY